MTSSRRFGRILGQKKIGHFGTLDPLASGLLLAAVGKATRLFPFYGKRDKTYAGRIRLGFSLPIRTMPTAHPVGEIPAAILIGRRSGGMDALVGPLIQLPPAFSAKKVGGLPLYAYARRTSPWSGRPFP